jgi:hypothetical protein
VKTEVKMKLKVITVLIMSLFLVSIIAVGTSVKAAKPNRILMIDIMAKGDDLDIPGAITHVKGRIEFDEVSGVLLGQVEFHIKIYDGSGEKIYSMKGKLKNAMVMILPFWYCEVRELTWINLWVVMGEGKLKTTDTDLEILYRNQIITLPNTGGYYVTTYTLAMLVSHYGEYVLGDDPEVFIWEQGGWAYAGLYGMPGGVAYLTKYMDKSVP